MDDIRQKNMEKLEASEDLIEAIYVSMKQIKVFPEVEASMGQFELIEELSEEYIYILPSAVETASFIHSPG